VSAGLLDPRVLGITACVCFERATANLLGVRDLSDWRLRRADRESERVAGALVCARQREDASPGRRCALIGHLGSHFSRVVLAPCARWHRASSRLGPQLVWRRIGLISKAEASLDR
jgi:hypothetical protein